MRVSSAAIAASLTLTALTADGALAGPRRPPPKPTCNILTDKPGDAVDTNIGPIDLPNDDNLDILSADIASNAKTVTAVIRLTALSTTDNNAPTGREYSITFKAASKDYVFKLIVNAQGETFTTPTKARSVFDTTNRQIRFHAEHANLTPPLPAKAGTKYQNILVTSGRWIGYKGGTAGSSSLGQADEGVTGTAYPAQYPSCVRVGA